MVNTLNLLTLILGAIQVTDILICIGLYFVYKRNTDYLIVTLVWIGMSTFFVLDNILGDIGIKHIFLSYGCSGLTGISMGEIISRHYKIAYSWRKASSLFIICYVSSLFLWFMGIENFTVLAFILSIGIVSPVVFNSISGLIKLKSLDSDKKSYIDYVYLVVMLVWGIHFLDYPFLRPLANLEFSIFGFSFALLITYLTSILFPVVINRKIHLNLNKTLESKLNIKTKELGKVQKQIIAKEKLASLGSLTAGIAHEIKNPLNIIKNGAYLINKYIESDLKHYQGMIDNNETHLLKDQISEDVVKLENISKLVARSVERADNIIRSMLIQSRTGKSVLHLEDLNKSITESLDLVVESSRGKYNYIPQTEFNLIALEPMNIYIQDLGRAFINVFDNALYAMNTKISKYGYKPKIEIRTFLEECFVRVEITDNGPGIEDHIIDQVMTPFFTTKPAGKGTGLGLTMVFDVVKLHEGEIEIESNPGEYTKFILRISRSL